LAASRIVSTVVASWRSCDALPAPFAGAMGATVGAMGASSEIDDAAAAESTTKVARVVVLGRAPPSRSRRRRRRAAERGGATREAVADDATSGEEADMTAGEARRALRWRRR